MARSHSQRTHSQQVCNALYNNSPRLLKLTCLKSTLPTNTCAYMQVRSDRQTFILEWSIPTPTHHILGHTCAYTRRYTHAMSFTVNTGTRKKKKKREKGLRQTCSILAESDGKHPLRLLSSWTIQRVPSCTLTLQLASDHPSSCAVHAQTSTDHQTHPPLTALLQKL